MLQAGLKSLLVVLICFCSLSASTPLFDTWTGYQVGAGATSVFVADLDGDGDQDEKAIEDRFQALVFLAVDPHIDSPCDERRYSNFLKPISLDV